LPTERGSGSWWRLIGLVAAVLVGAAGLTMLAWPHRLGWREGSLVSAPSPTPASAADGLVQLAQRIRRGDDEAAPPESTPSTPPPAEAEKALPPDAPADPRMGPDLSRQSQAEVDKKNVGCVSCHTATDSANMHQDPTVKLACVDCHGGRGDAVRQASVTPDSSAYQAVKNTAHVQPRVRDLWRSSANPVRSYALLNQESAEFIRFFNPGDLRVAALVCGGCHTAEVKQVEKSMMTTGPMLWSAALYNNGSFPLKRPQFGESYGADGLGQRLSTTPPPTLEDITKRGVLQFLEPLPRFEIGQPGNVLRIFERGGQRPLELGIPFVDELPGRPANRLSARGFGTLNRTDPVWLNLQRTRLFDPLLSLLGTNDHPGDFRSSGCSACHVIYANDRSPAHSGPYAEHGNLGHTATTDPTIPKGQSGHPIKHRFTNSIPSSQCVVCHMHPGTTVTQSYYGYTWWDNETDGDLMYPEQEKNLSAREVAAIESANPEGSAVRGKWSDPAFLNNITDLNPRLTRTQFADFHGHGWVFRAVYKQDRKGNLLDAKSVVVAPDDPQRFEKAVHLKDIHLEKGMHCTDCHFKGDAHGNGKLYGETRAAIEIACSDCHGTIRERATLRTSGPAAPPGGTDLAQLRTPFGQRRFQWQGDRLTQRSMVQEGLAWEVVQVLDSISPASDWAIANPERAQKSRLAKTLRRDGTTWGDAVPKDREGAELAHADSRMTCQTCHTSWVTSCFGCHLPMRANERRPMLHFEGTTQRNWTQYNFQTLRDDVFMLALDGTSAGKRISPARSSCAVLVGSQNANREWVYSQQQTVSAEGLSGHSFSTFVPHTVRATETKTCTDCHVSGRNDNNAWMAQLLMHGTNFYNFLGRFVYVAEGKAGLEAVVVTERDEPQAVIGSYLHQVAYPTNYAKHTKDGGLLGEKYHHRGRDVFDLFGRDEILGIQLRGEYLYTANGRGGFRAYDVAQIDQKGFSERIVTAPVSPLGQRLYVKTKFATAVAAPTTLAVDPTRTQRPENEEPKIHPLYAYIYVTDREEGLVVVGNPADSPDRPGVATLLDGDPSNNFLERALAFNPDGILRGAVNIAIAGTYAYILADRGMVVVDLNEPLSPRVVATVEAPALVKPRAVAIQFRYAFVTDAEGLKIVDVTTPARPRVIPNATVRLADARGLYVARTYAYVANGAEGLAIIDVERPEQPTLEQTYNANGVMNDTTDVKIGMTNASVFAYVADGRNGLRVLQLTSPKETPTYLGFSPKPKPQLIATAKTRGPALAISKGIDRDRAVDESGNQIAVFSRVGSRPFNLAEMQRLYLRDGRLYSVVDEPPSSPREVAPPKRDEPAPPAAPSRPRRGRE
jgi:LVIVD repeat